MAAKARSGRSARAAKAPKPAVKKWMKPFLKHLAETSNVTASAKKAAIVTSTAYEAKRADPEFNRQWRQALCEGYDSLEMELVFRLRSGEIKPARDAKKGVRVYDNPTSFRLLAAHREEAAKERADRDNEDADSILASLDAKLDMMRRRQLALKGDDGEE